MFENIKDPVKRILAIQDWIHSNYSKEKFQEDEETYINEVEEQEHFEKLLLQFLSKEKKKKCCIL